MRILIAANHYPVASGRYMADAFRRLGHEVQTIGFPKGTSIWGLTVASRYEWKVTHWVKDIDPTWPDLVIVMDSDTAIWEYVADCGFHSPIVVYGVDNHVRSYESGLFRHYFLAHYHGPTYPVDPKRADHTWIPCGYDPVHFTPSPIAWADREYDVCMVGVMYDRRRQVIEAMKAAGLKVFAATGLLYDEYRAAYQNSRISLCVSAYGDVAQRIFETGAMGCAILTDPLLDFGDDFTNEALHLYGRMTYTNPAEAVRLAKDLLGQPAATFEVGMIRQSDSALPLGAQAAAEMQKNCLPHTWDARAKVIVDWYEDDYCRTGGVDLMIGKTGGIALADNIEVNKPIGHVNVSGNLVATDLPMMPDKRRLPFLNLGCGRTHLPGERPAHHALVPEGIYQGEQWVNVDRSANVNADCVFDLFSYPWPLESDSYDGALLSHLCEHIPHEITIIAEENNPEALEQWERYLDVLTPTIGHDDPLRLAYPGKVISDRGQQLMHLQDGWFAFFAELYRVLRNGAEVHILSPHARSDGAISDPTHTRYLLPDSFTHSMQPDPNAPFEYSTGGIHFEMVDQKVGVTGEYNHMLPLATDPADVQQAKRLQLEHLARSQNNVIPEFYVRLKVVK